MSSHGRIVVTTVGAWAAAAAIAFAGTASAPPAPPAGPGIYYARATAREGDRTHEDRLAQSLRRITGLGGLLFSADGSLTDGDTAQGGAPTARLVLGAALASGMAFVIEDHSGSREVHFARLDPGTAVTDAAGRREPFLLWRVHLDFEDLAGVDASPGVRAAFDPGFALLHELMHGLGCEDAADTLNSSATSVALSVRPLRRRLSVQISRRSGGLLAGSRRILRRLGGRTTPRRLLDAEC